MTSVQRRRRFVYRGQAPKVPIGPTSNRSNNEDHKDPLGSNKPGPSEAPTRPFKAPAGAHQAPLAQDPGPYCYSQ